MRSQPLFLIASLLLMPVASEAQDVEGYEVLPDGTVELTFAWPGCVGGFQVVWVLDGLEGGFASEECTATFPVGVLDEPLPFPFPLVASSGRAQTLVQVEIDATPEFRNVHDARAVVGREWRWTPDVVHPDGDAFELTVDEDDLPVGMVFDGHVFRWTPNHDHLLQGDPPPRTTSSG